MSLPTTAWESIFELPTEKSIARFMEIREEHFRKMEEDKQKQLKEVRDFATMAHKRVQQVRECNPRFRAALMSDKLTPLRLHAMAYSHFYTLQTTIPESYPSSSGMSKENSDNHLESLDTAIQEALDEAERFFHCELDKLGLRGGA